MQRADKMELIAGKCICVLNAGRSWRDAPLKAYCRRAGIYVP